MPVCILVMCGLPASGKTTLVSQFQASVSGKLTCHVVDYDKLMPAEVERDLIKEQNTQSTELSSWKKYREGIVRCVDYLLQLITPEPCQDGDTNVDASTQCLSTEEVPQSVLYEKMLQHDGAEQLWHQFSHSLDLTASADSAGTVVVVDDNMYYRSMRYNYYQLARKYCLGFCEVFVDCSSATALSRNKQRMLGKVDENVIVTMATKMEVPDSATHHWEKHSLVVSSESPDNCSKIDSLVRTAMLDPVLAPVEDLEGIAESRHICSANMIHQADQILRKLLAQDMQKAKRSGQSKNDMKYLSSKLSEVKMAILDEMRSGVITFDLDVQNASKEEDSDLFKYLKELFEQRTSEIR